MTVIAWDGHTLAADKKAVNGSYSHRVTKIRRLRDGRLFAGGGSSDFILAMAEWLDEGANREDFPKSQADKDDWQPCVVITRDRRVLRYERSHVPFEIEEPFCALGSGRDYALAAMHLGKTAAEAVAVACRFDSACGMGLDTLTLEAA